jgi:hypothetical protein
MGGSTGKLESGAQVLEADEIEAIEPSHIALARDSLLSGDSVSELDQTVYIRQQANSVAWVRVERRCGRREGGREPPAPTS